MTGAASPIVRVPQRVQDARLRSARAPWRERAECRLPDVQHVDFYPASLSEAWPALAVCRQCPVRLECLADAIEGDERHGVWGGTTESERARMSTNRIRRSG